MENEENVLRLKLSQMANNVSEKMSILEARDRLLRLKRHKQTNLATAVAVVGTCPDMCPEYERYFRVDTNQVTALEMIAIDDTNGCTPDDNRMIKEYRRSGADQEEPLPHELRPTHVLNRTMDFLCTNVMDNQSVNTSEWYDFVWSRTRSIRKDITQQHLCDLSSVALTEKCARFHIHCAAALCEEDIKDFDPKINEENLSNCLQSLKDFYYDLSLRDIYCENEAEFRSYEILLHLNDAGILRDVKNYRKQIRDSSPVRFAIQAFYSYQSNNYINFFKLVSNCDYLTSCVTHRYFSHVRQQAFKILRKSYTSKSSSIQEFPNDLLIRNLGFENEDHLMQFCDHIGLECGDDIVYLVRGHNEANTMKAMRSMRLVENKRNCSVGQIVNGSPLPVNPYKSVPVHDSFDSDGRLKAEAYEALDQQMKTSRADNTIITSNTAISSTNSQTHPIFMSKPAFGTPFSNSITGSSLFATNSKPSIGSSFTEQQSQPKLNFSLNPTLSQESKPNIFSLSKPLNAFQFPQTSLTQFTKPNFQFNTSSTSKQDIQFPQQIHINQVSIPETTDSDINEEIIEKLSQNISNDLIDSVIKELLPDICGQELEKMRNIMINEMVCKLFSDILLSITNDMIRETASDVIRDEMDLKMKEQEEKRILIENISIEISNKMIDSFVDSQIRSISQEVYDKCYEELVDKRNELIANDVYNDSVEIIINDIASEVYMTATNERELMINNFNEQRLKRLTLKYFNKWKVWYLLRKRYAHYKNAFPAAPNWNSKSSTTNLPKYSFSESFYNNVNEELVERELLANHFLNVSIDEIVKQIASHVYELAIKGIDLSVESLKRKRLNRLSSKYFNLWKQFYLKRKQLKNHRKSFPAAPNWGPTQAITSSIRHSFSDIESEVKIPVKRLRRENDEQKKTTDCFIHSTNSFNDLFNEEISESKALTKRLSDALQSIPDDDFYHSFEGQKPIVRDFIEIYSEEEVEEENDGNEVQIVDVFETSIDKMNRLKRMLDEEKDCVSLNNFVSFLTNNEDINLNIEESDYQYMHQN